MERHLTHADTTGTTTGAVGDAFGGVGIGVHGGVGWQRVRIEKGKVEKKENVKEKLRRRNAWVVRV